MPGFTLGTADRGSVPFLGQSRLIDDTYLVDEAQLLNPFEGVVHPFVGVNRTDISDARTLGATFCVPVDVSAASGENFGVAPGSQALQPYESLSPRADFYLKRIVHRGTASRALQLNFRNPNDLAAWQTETAMKALWYEYSRMFYTGVGGAAGDREFLGLAALATGTQLVVGTPASIPDSIDAGLSRLRPPDPRTPMRAILMNSVTKAIYLQQLRAAGVPPGYSVHPILGPWLCHGKIPILETNFIPDDNIPQPPVFGANVYLVVFGRENDGLYGIFQDGIGSNGVTVQQGILEQRSDAIFWEVAWHVGLVLGSRSCLVCISFAGLTTPPGL